MASPPKVGSPPACRWPKETCGNPFCQKSCETSVTGTGVFDRITPEDVEADAGSTPKKSSVSNVASPVATSSPAPPLPAPKAAPYAAPLPGASIVPFTRMQAAISKNMLESISVRTFHILYPVMTDALYEKVDPKGVTMTALLAKVVETALGQHPVVNANCKDGRIFTYNSSINIAVAVAIAGGLIIPVLQDADKILNMEFRD